VFCGWVRQKQTPGEVGVHKIKLESFIKVSIDEKTGGAVRTRYNRAQNEIEYSRGPHGSGNYRNLNSATVKTLSRIANWQKDR